MRYGRRASKDGIDSDVGIPSSSSVRENEFSYQNGLELAEQLFPLMSMRTLDLSTSATTVQTKPHEASELSDARKERIRITLGLFLPRGGLEGTSVFEMKTAQT